MTAAGPDEYVGDYEFPDLYGAYREHLDHCPGIHTGLLADCVEGARLAAAWLDEDWPGYGAAGTERWFWGVRSHA
ncbi:hypothetical protein [Streptomyces spectabilis]|uniref:Uncharacterized protein n=1 Tax=Streptomyces spectabilis TaxID=68270 RepID=A0A5P2XFE9_STRST|nr:hypothetical protein [Streptomyces spectabilis]MBB5103691.1 hypothetical protein [Streptomyces spectabilis]MCI3904066.1 hypothetical protein [Streptomyces spectabilis]QEV61202.1 hypothetical protein CP982_22905 [Streptomyces spectabilis]GGV19353.1 hypothetical protein GCM10010245_32740 [Streptomyces spectabilis]